MIEKSKNIAASLAALLVVGILTALECNADVLTKIQYRAYCVDERISLGGWVSFLETAEGNAEEHLTLYPDHEVVIQEDDYS